MNNSLLAKQERPVSCVPKKIIIAFVIFLGLQIVHHGFLVGSDINVEELPPPLEKNFLSLFALSDSIVTSKLTMLWLQAFDNQPGISIPFAKLNYNRVIDWLRLIQSLDEKSGYPLLSASRLYSKVPEEKKKRLMLDYVKDEYLKDPDLRWRWMTHCVYVAKHELKDLDMALAYARIIRENTSSGVAPSWVRQMEIFILEDMDEIESAKVLLGGLLESGEIRDQHEFNFLSQRLQELGLKNKGSSD